MGLFVTLGVDILHMIFTNLGVGDVKNFCDMLISTHIYDEASVDELRACRLSPLPYFSRAFSNPPLLLSAMLSHSIILSGSRATEYFYPNSCDKNSGWSFFITADTLCMMSAVNALEQCGVIWDYNTPEHASNKQTKIDHLKGHTIVKNKRYMVTLTREIYRTAIDCIIRFGSSTDQSIIFGHAAVCLCKKRMKKTETVFWTDGGSSYTTANSEGGPHTLSQPPHPLNYRRIGDDTCETVNFTPYFDVALEPLIRYLNLIAESKQWLEYENKATLLNFPLSLSRTIPSEPWSAQIDMERPIESMKYLSFPVYVDFDSSSAKQGKALEKIENKTLRRFVNVGLGSAAAFVGNYIATLPI